MIQIVYHALMERINVQVVNRAFNFLIFNARNSVLHELLYPRIKLNARIVMKIVYSALINKLAKLSKRKFHVLYKIIFLKILSFARNVILIARFVLNKVPA